MSNKSFFSRKPKTVKAPTPPPPRSTVEVKTEYEKICGLAGELQFKMVAQEAELKQLNMKLAGLHNEYRDSEKHEKETAAKDEKNESLA